MKTIKLLNVGSDPEVFFLDKDGNPHSVEGLIGGTKNRPKKMVNLPDGFFVQEDNVAAEFNIPPANNSQVFAQNIMAGLSYVEGEAKKKGMKVVCEPCLNFPLEQLKTRHARTLGCDPDMNIWTLETNPTPTPPPALRTAAGHVHISWTTPDTEQQVAIGKMCDLFLGVPSILATKYSARRSLYGKAGAVRLKSYGLEYRTLDNFWLKKPAHMEQVFTNVQDGILRLNTEKSTLLDAIEDFDEEIQNAINHHNQDLARLLCDRFNVYEFQ